MSAHSHDDFAVEPIPGLPEALPEGEEILWQGRPDAMALARDALMIRWVAGYFVLLAIWRAAVVSENGGSAEITAAVLWMVGIGAVACGFLYLVAYIQARATVYTLTNRRVAMRIGAALTVTFNLPFKQIADAGFKPGPRGTGTIAMRLTGKNTISYLIAWPHVRPWKLSPSEPALRCIPDGEKVAKMFAEAARTRMAEPQISRAAPDAAAIAAE